MWESCYSPGGAKAWGVSFFTISFKMSDFFYERNCSSLCFVGWVHCQLYVYWIASLSNTTVVLPLSAGSILIYLSFCRDSSASQSACDVFFLWGFEHLRVWLVSCCISLAVSFKRCWMVRSTPLMTDWRISSHISTLRMRTEMVFEMLVFSPLNHLTQLVDWENFIILNCWESTRSCIINLIMDCWQQIHWYLELQPTFHWRILICVH